jgi:hypothetical protein
VALSKNKNNPQNMGVIFIETINYFLASTFDYFGSS